MKRGWGAGRRLRRVRLVRGEGRGVSSEYEGGGGQGGRGAVRALAARFSIDATAASRAALSWKPPQNHTAKKGASSRAATAASKAYLVAGAT